MINIFLKYITSRSRTKFCFFISFLLVRCAHYSLCFALPRLATLCLVSLAQEMIDEADRDGDGEINEDEFLRIMKKTSLY